MKVPNWLTQGEGEMFDTPQGEKNVIFSKIISILDADSAMCITDAAMEPKIPVGAVIVMMQQKLEEIVSGKIYYIQTENFAVVRIVRKNELSNSKLALKAINENSYDDIIIDTKDILNLYLVTGVVAELH